MMNLKNGAKVYTNYAGKIELVFSNNTTLRFNKANLNIIVEPVTNSFENIYHSQINILKGYKTVGELDIYFMNDEQEKFNNLITYLYETEQQNTNIQLSMYQGNYSNKIKTFLFDRITSDTEYNNYIGGGWKTGLKFNVKFETGRLSKTLPTFWTGADYENYILSAEILIDYFVCNEN